MPLQPGTTLGPYAVTAKIGAGGMGEVYRARDTKLDRDVALKVLPQAFTDDPDRLARFEREAKVLASLNHPNIGHIYGLEEAEGTRALVLELIEGPTLADRISQGPIPIDEALPIAKQIAEGLEAAHEAGVIHRDLKPANIKVRDDGMVKVLDFGLAKAFEPEAGSVSASMSPTISLTAAATQMGMVIGTAAYMAPEQAKGLPVDKRADIWAFGAVLFEMLTGKKLFEAGDVSEMLASVLVKDPDISSMGTHVPANIRSVVRRCLVKDPKQRLRDIGDVRLAMAETFETTVSAPSAETLVAQPAGWRQPLPWVAGIVVGGVITGLAAWSMTRPESPRVVRFTVTHNDVSPLHIAAASRDIAISPNGEYIAYLTGTIGIGAERLHVRPLDQLGAETLVSEGEMNSPFFSPDSESVGFYDRSSTPFVLKSIAVRGGHTSTICDLPEGRGTRGASWGANGSIIFGTADGRSGLWQVAAVGGEPRQLTTPDAEKGEVNHQWPEILPGGEAVLFTITADPVEESQIAVLSLDTLEQKVVVSGGTFPQYSSTGHLLYVVQGNLWAVGLDLNRLETVGDAVPVQEGVLTKEAGGADFSVSADGSLAYIPGIAGGTEARTLVWVDRQGREEPLPTPPAPYDSPRISPDGRSVAVERRNPENTDVMVYDLQQGTEVRLTFDPGVDESPLWSPDGRRVFFRHGPRIGRLQGLEHVVHLSLLERAGTRLTDSGPAAVVWTQPARLSQIEKTLERRIPVRGDPCLGKDHLRLATALYCACDSLGS